MVVLSSSAESADEPGMAPVRKAPIYGNLTIVDPSNQPMFRCDRRKFEWYIRKGLAERIDENTARLLFEPKGKGNWGDPYLMGEKHNVCVVCGEDDALKLTRHHVVPYCYRSAFPDEYKNHNPYDILPVCRECHDVYEHDHAHKLKVALGRQYIAPTDGDVERVNMDEQKACKFASALSRNAEQIPEARKKEMLAFIATFLGHEANSDELDELSLRKVNISRLKSTHGEMVVTKVVDDLDAFVKLWRKNFISSMQPKFMPPNWNADRSLKSTRAE